MSADSINTTLMRIARELENLRRLNAIELSHNHNFFVEAHSKRKAFVEEMTR